MKAVRFHRTGGPEVLRYEEVDRPISGAGQVLVRVAGAAYNPADGGLRGGFLPIPITLPHTPGYDVSGTVEVLGDGVNSLAIGDRVVGFLPMTENGAAAEFVVAPAEALVVAPTRVALEDAAGLPSVGLTAHQALFEVGRLSAGQRILINGAGGPVGGYAVQLAKGAGAQVIATASPRSRDTVAAAGADEIIDHTETSVLDAVPEQVDVLLNLAPIDEQGFAAMVALVRDGGVVVSTTPRVATPGDASRGVRAATVYVHPDRSVLTQLVDLVDNDALHIDIAQRVPLAELSRIHELAETGGVHGKIIAVPSTV
ncbi:zinc-binding dehydrogenase [Nakamurella sp. YIM 132087]|uniref:Zinc-binding dehydrogenase n=1 Tax=Nakamurella alba TaxID=2665158 RepID=A0A7K1FFD0_9ACTN|nr:NADP-dependent oxidoreductase [Nakamurella alba]MTD12825.1 zinc-binding dehydrogenase [Nakamurella alba]